MWLPPEPAVRCLFADSPLIEAHISVQMQDFVHRHAPDKRVCLGVSRHVRIGFFDPPETLESNRIDDFRRQSQILRTNRERDRIKSGLSFLNASPLFLSS